MLKMQTKDNKWVVEDKGRYNFFDTSFDAWGYIFLMRVIRPKAPFVPRSLYPVKSLDPRPEMKKKKIIIIGETL